MRLLSQCCILLRSSVPGNLLVWLVLRKVWKKPTRRISWKWPWEMIQFNSRLTSVLVTNLQENGNGVGGVQWLTQGHMASGEEVRVKALMFSCPCSFYCSFLVQGELRGGFLFSVDFYHSVNIHILSVHSPVHPSIHSLTRPFILPTIYPSTHLVQQQIFTTDLLWPRLY